IVRARWIYPPSLHRRLGRVDEGARWHGKPVYFTCTSGCEIRAEKVGVSRAVGASPTSSRRRSIPSIPPSDRTGGGPPGQQEHGGDCDDWCGSCPHGPQCSSRRLEGEPRPESAGPGQSGSSPGRRTARMGPCTRPPCVSTCTYRPAGPSRPSGPPSGRSSTHSGTGTTCRWPRSTTRTCGSGRPSPWRWWPRATAISPRCSTASSGSSALRPTSRFSTPWPPISSRRTPSHGPRRPALRAHRPGQRGRAGSAGRRVGAAGRPSARVPDRHRGRGHARPAPGHRLVLGAGPGRGHRAGPRARHGRRPQIGHTPPPIGDWAPGQDEIHAAPRFSRGSGDQDGGAGGRDSPPAPLGGRVNDHFGSDDGHQLDEDLATAAALISAADEVALAYHVATDGDALGSMLALHHVLRGAGRRSVASFAGTQVTGPHYRELPGLDLLTDPFDYPAEPEVMITLDCGSLGRLGDLAINAKAAKELVVVDHHVSNT